MNPLPIVLVDFDFTLIQTDALRGRLFAVLGDFGIQKNMLNDLEGRANREKPFHPFSALRLIPARSERASLKRQMLALYATKAQYNFKGVERFLGELSQTHALILLSFGHRHHQFLKINQSGLKKFFRSIVITTSQRKKRNLAEYHRKYGNRVLVLDDSKPVIAAARAIGMRAIRVRKGKKDGAYYGKLLKRIRAAWG